MDLFWRTHTGTCNADARAQNSTPCARDQGVHARVHVSIEEFTSRSSLLSVLRIINEVNYCGIIGRTHGMDPAPQTIAPDLFSSPSR